MPRGQKETAYLDNLMFTLMRKYNLEQEPTVKAFRQICREKGIKMARASAYRWYDKIAGKIDVSGAFQQNINQFFMDLTKVASKATRNYLASEGEDSSYALDEYLRVAELQKNALNLQQQKAGDPTGNIFMQFLQQNNSQEINVHETLQNITEGLGEFGPLLQRLSGAQMDSRERTIPAIPAESEAKDTNRKR